MERILYVPTLHFQEEMPEFLASHVLRKMDTPAYTFSESLWVETQTRIERRIKDTGTSPEHLHIFMEGLHEPVTDATIIKNQSPPQRFIWNLRERGANVHPNEDAALLLECELILKEAVDEMREFDLDYFSRAAVFLLSMSIVKRDIYSFGKILEKTPCDGTAVVFRGATHTLDKLLKKFCRKTRLEYIITREEIKAIKGYIPGLVP